MGDGILAKNRTQAVQEGQNVAGNISDLVDFFLFPLLASPKFEDPKGVHSELAGVSAPQTFGHKLCSLLIEGLSCHSCWQNVPLEFHVSWCAEGA